MTIKVLHFYKTYYPDTVGGAEFVINQIIRSTAVLGIEAQVLTLTPGMDNSVVTVDGHKVCRCKTLVELASTPISLSAFMRFRELARDADIIHYHFPYPFADLLHFTSRIKKPTVVTYHSDIVKQSKILSFYRPLQKAFLNSVDTIVATSPNYLNSSPVLQQFRDKVSVIPIGLDTTNLSTPIAERYQYWQQRLPEEFFLFIGAIRYYKGLHVAIEAVKGTGIKLVIAGSGGIEEELRAYASKNGLENVIFLGQVSEEDKSALLDLCYGFVFPSHLRSEAFGVSLLEAAAHSKPLISCELGTGTSFVNLHNETGLVIPPSSPVALRQAMEYLLSNPEIAQNFGANARNRVVRDFSESSVAGGYANLYKKLHCC